MGGNEIMKLIAVLIRSTTIRYSVLIHYRPNYVKQSFAFQPPVDGLQAGN